MRRGFLRNWKAMLLGLALVALAIQFVPVSRTNPAGGVEVDAPPQPKAVLQRACYDCHSNATRWPWYSHVAPVSWLVSSDVEEGREEMNLSRWEAYTPERQAKLRRKIRREVDSGDMPLWYYVTMHPAARLSEEDLAALRSWTGEATGK
jgi:mono/diheme cytochrome c family protein